MYGAKITRCTRNGARKAEPSGFRPRPGAAWQGAAGGLHVGKHVGQSSLADLSRVLKSLLYTAHLIPAASTTLKGRADSSDRRSSDRHRRPQGDEIRLAVGSDGPQARERPDTSVGCEQPGRHGVDGRCARAGATGRRGDPDPRPVSDQMAGGI